MPSINLAATADRLDTPQELFDLLVELEALGWRGSVMVGEVSADPEAPKRWEIQASRTDPTEVDGTGRLRAGVGDWKVVIGTTYTLMTQAAYDAAYGGA
jgi:hypothetical protein